MKTFQWKDIAVSFDSRMLKISNACLHRTFDLTEGLLKTLELGSASGEILGTASSKCCDFECYGAVKEMSELGCSIEGITVQAVEDDPFEAPHALVRVEIFEPYSQSRLYREFMLYPEQPFYALRNAVASEVQPHFYWMNRKRLNQQYDEYRGRKNRYHEPLMDILHPAPGFRIARTVEFRGHTDVHEHPVEVHPWNGASRELTGNILYCENSDGHGVMILQEAPPSTERREREEYDFRLDDSGDIHSICWGILPEDIRDGRLLASYRNMVAVYQSPDEAEQALKEYQKLRTAHAAPNYAVTANAWGCGQFSQKISRQFLLDEIAAAADCGAEYYQIDDGWQMGRSLGYLINYNLNRPLREFWAINPETVGESHFDHLVRQARESGVKLALWLAPSTNIAYRDWEEFKDMVLRFHRRYGFDLFKIDHAAFLTYEAEHHFEEMLRSIRLESEKAIFFNLDVTAEQRGGFFRFLEYGTLFLENRYICHDWKYAYHPEAVLRKVWELAHYVRLQHLQIEIPSPWDINREYFNREKLLQPDTYAWSYWAAIALFANPLLWFSPSSVPVAERAKLRSILELHRRYREEIFSCEIRALGSRPNGSALCGFVALQDHRPRFALLFREHNAEESSISLPGDWQLLAGRGTAADGLLTLPEKTSFALFRSCP